MKPLQLSNENLSEFVQSNTLESDSGDCFGVNVYEFQEGEDLYGPRARGYQKPKHMWMAKDQALTNIKSNSPTPATTTLDFGGDCCTTQNGLTSVPPGNLRCPSPNNMTYNMGSPSTSGSIQGLSTALSSCTTSNSLCSHTSPAIGLNIAEVTSTFESPTFTEVKNEKGTLLTCEINSVVKKSKSSVKLTTKKRTTGKYSLKKFESSSDTNSSVPDTSKVQSSNNKQSYSRKHRQPRSRTNRKSKRSPVSESSLTSFYPAQTPNLSTGNHLSLSPSLTMTEQISQESPVQTPMYSKGLTSSAFVSGGLKIRLRRDAAMDFNIGKGKRAKSKTAPATFRIVESWCDADAPGGDFTRRARAATSNSTSPTFSLVSGGLRVGDIVWAKLAGYPYWPSQVNAIWARTAHQLSQATLLPTSQSLDSNASSLAVLATPSDPSLAAGYTARVDWLAWDQCSYLSCAKLYPFKESFDKLYNPRTRVKGYAEAVRLAKQIVNGTYIPNENLDSQLCMSPQNKSHSSLSGQISAPPSTDSQWSSMTTLSSSLEIPTTGTSNQTSRELMDKHTILLPSELPPDPYVSSQLSPSPHSVTNLYSGEGLVRTSDAFSSTSNNSCLLIGDKSLELPELDNMAMWAPLPQLDVSGLGVFHVPTFSEDEEELDQSIVNQLHLDFGSCLQ